MCPFSKIPKYENHSTLMWASTSLKISLNIRPDPAYLANNATRLTARTSIVRTVLAFQRGI